MMKKFAWTVECVGCPLAVVLSLLFWSACGQVYRPVVIPCSTGGVPGCPVETNPAPSNFHAILGISSNSPGYSGEAMQIDVSGDSIVGETTISTANSPSSGQNPTHLAISPNDSKVFVAAAASVFPGGVDSVATFTPVFQSTLSAGLGSVNTISLPSLPGQSSAITALTEGPGNVVTATISTPLLQSPISNVLVGTQVVISGESVPGYNGTFTLTGISATTLQYTATATTPLTPCGPTPPLSPCAAIGTASIPGQPVYLASTENAAMYVANFNSSSVAKINTTSNVVVNAVPVGDVAALGPAANPVSMAEMPNALKLYVANQGNNTVSSLNTVDLSSNVVTGFTGITPVWVVARGDNQKVYVLTEGDGQLVTIDTATDTVTSSVPVGIGANFLFLDPTLNRLYVVNPVTATVYVFSDTGGTLNGVVSDIPNPLAVIPFTAGSAGCPAGCTPVSVTALLDGSRFYVASYQSPAVCPDSNVAGACVIPGLTVFDANNLKLEYPTSATPAMHLLTWPPFVTNQYAVPPVAGCAAPLYPALYVPGDTRFRVFTVSSADSSRVYVSMCDAGAVAVVNTTDSNANNPDSGLPADSAVNDLLSPYSAGAIQANGQPSPQNPTFLIMGQ